MEDPAISPTTGRAFPCSNCGASLQFAPGVGRLACSTCGTVNDLPAIGEAELAAAHEELDFREALQREAGREPDIEQQVVTCPQCGAQTVFDPNVIASHCAFCASPMVSVTAHATRQIRPRGVVPFALETATAQQRFRSWIEGRWFAPNALKQTVKSAQGVRGVYVPCWTYDAETTSEYAGERGINRTVVETRRNAQGQLEQVTRIVTDWYHAQGVVHVVFDDELVLASHSIPDHLANVLEGWDTSALVPVADDYLAGFTVEAYQVGLEAGFAEAQDRFAQAIRRAVRSDIGGDQQRVHRVNTHYGAIHFKHILLPVWIASYRFKDKAYRVVVNGQTGRVQGDRPWSVWKISAAVVVAVIVGAIVFALVQQQ
jgi:ribosomal protein S27AE